MWLLYRRHSNHASHPSGREWERQTVIILACHNCIGTCLYCFLNQDTLVIHAHIKHTYQSELGHFFFYLINSHAFFDSLFLYTAFERLSWPINSETCLCHPFPVGTILMIRQYVVLIRNHILRGSSALLFCRKALWLATGFLCFPGPDCTQCSSDNWAAKDWRCCNQQGNLSEKPWSLFLVVRKFLEERGFYLIFFPKVVLRKQK